MFPKPYLQFSAVLVFCHSGNQVYNRSVLLRFAGLSSAAVNPPATFRSHIFIHGGQSGQH